jgi:hypothetical protein
MGCISLMQFIRFDKLALCGDEWHSRPHQLLDYWLSIHPTVGVLPGRQHFDPAAVKSLLPEIWLLDVAGEPPRFRYRLIGSKLSRVIGAELTGRWLEQCDLAGNSEDVIDRYRRVIEMREPSWRRFEQPILQHSSSFKWIENVLLPLATDGYQVDKILGLTVYYD